MASFTGGVNVAMKIPPDKYEATVAFYRETLGLELTHAPEESVADSYRLAFGGVTLWLDRVEGISEPEVWLEIKTDDLEAATAHLANGGIETCDEVEPLPPDMRAHWIRNPAGVVHLLEESTGERLPRL